ncbi:ATP-binding protein [Aeoliella sp. ICT_H6.2]|uniref:histidine kinase n=1 Tax=Aeoliella straminimaris TaxID=2954799 RepID=A0A9X2FBT4_9BACT|nr:ATP-binding protein [Aeoliella straminimaris]MCO6045639.1 ATP-binding protein [Aeoliella straminimaris]
MSYSTFKRVFGESSLERKCRWWFGVSLGLLIFLSFYFYGAYAKNLIYKQNKELGKQLVRTAYAEVHRDVETKIKKLDPDNKQDLQEAAARIEDDSTAEDKSNADKDDDDLFMEMMNERLRYGTKFRAETILPPNDFNLNQPQKGTEQDLFTKYQQFRLSPEQLKDESHFESSTDIDTDGFLPAGAEPFDRVAVVGGKKQYQYYYPLYARASCVGCHKYMPKEWARRNLEEGELLAIMRISFDHAPTANKLASGEAILWTAAIVTGFLSMLMLWAVVRYVIVKPVQHLRDVANAVREGDVDQRAEIYTGDEFEELAAAFNRMVRQLLRQRDELTEVNSELDGKLDELAQANMRLYELNRIKSDFLATMSHELRTPLNSILGFSDVLQDIDSLNDKQKRYVGNIRRSGALLLEMINDILDLAKMESGRMDIRPSEFRIESIVDALCDMARPLAESKNIDIECTFASGLPPVEQDQAKVQQILNNLLSNAIKFTPEGGRITITASKDDTGMLCVEVDDTGIGISEADQQLVFEKFRQGGAALPGGDAMTREYSGTGLGLSIVRELCRLLGGEVTLSSVVGKGSTFTVTLPWKIEPTSDLDAQLKEQVASLHRPHVGDYMTPVKSEENGANVDTPARKDAG